MSLDVVSRIFFGSFALSMALIVSPVRAGVVEFGLFKGLGYEQDSITTPVIGSPDFAVFEAYLETDDPADFSEVSVVGGANPLVLSLDAFFADWIGEEYFSSANPQIDLDAAYPSSNVYTFKATVAGLGIINEDILLGINAYPNVVPIFSGSTISTLSGFDVSQPLNLVWNAPGNGNNVTEVFYDIYETGTDNLVYESAEFLPGVGSDLLPANTLDPNKEYEIALLFNNLITLGPPVNFLSGEANNEFARATLVTFTTAPLSPAPEPMTIGLGLCGVAGLLMMTMRRERNHF